MTDFSGRVALVTGASRGLGYAMARELGARGAHVIALARTVGGLEELDDEIKAAAPAAPAGNPAAAGDAAGAGAGDAGDGAGDAPGATLVPLDISDDPALERLGAAIFERWGRLDLWIHAAIHAPALSPTEHIDARDLDRALAMNVRATQRLIRVLDPLLRLSPHGRAMFMADETGLGARFHGAYQASKQGQIALAAAWAREVEATPSLRVTIAAPPPMPTAVRARFYPGEDRSRLTDPAQVARRLVDDL